MIYRTRTRMIEALTEQLEHLPGTVVTPHCHDVHGRYHQLHCKTSLSQHPDAREDRRRKHLDMEIITSGQHGLLGLN